MKLITRIYLGIGLILFIFTIVTISYLYQAQKVEKEMQKLLRVQELIRLSDNGQKTLIDMETGFRGYILGENEAFLEPYYNGLKKGSMLFEALKRQSDDATEKALLNEIEKTGTDWVSNFAEPIISAKRKAIQNPKNKAEFDSLYTNVLKAGKG